MARTRTAWRLKGKRLAFESSRAGLRINFINRAYFVRCRHQSSGVAMDLAPATGMGDPERMSP